jgi:hypothetical protein
MAVREYESWLLHSLRGASNSARPIEEIRDAKGTLRQYYEGYKPALHQHKLTRTLSVDSVWARSRSFHKLVCTLADIAGMDVSKLRRPLLG